MSSYANLTVLGLSKTQCSPIFNFINTNLTMNDIFFLSTISLL